ncbi:MAG: PadR family transcriptional regulator [Candidatus Methanoplasma sp.]|jgi:DNA-binding PadR family transcriptional regulator|nr:PadR family transcriptional regulator [Candidatus Methanoplasma sp.]
MVNFNMHDRYNAFGDEGPSGAGGLGWSNDGFDERSRCGGGFSRSGATNLGGFRARRGSIGPMILFVLQDGPKTGYEIILSFEERSLGAWRPSPGSIYPTLDTLEKKGLVRMLTDSDRKTYELTEEGVGFVKKMDGRLTGHWKRADWEEMKRVRDELSEVMELVRAVMSERDEDKNQELTSLIKEFKKSLYTLCDSAGKKKEGQK